MITQNEIIECAAKGRYPAVPVDCADIALYYTMRDLYRDFKNGKISPEQGAEYKAEALAQYRADCTKLRNADRIIAHNAKMWKRIEAAAMRYRAERTLENADKFIEAVYGVPLKEGEKEWKEAVNTGRTSENAQANGRHATDAVLSRTNKSGAF